MAGNGWRGEALADRRDLPPGDSALAATIANLADIVRERGRLEGGRLPQPRSAPARPAAPRYSGDRHESHQILSAVLWRRGQHDEARTTAEEGVALSDALGGLGQALLGQGRDQDALASLERSLKDQAREAGYDRDGSGGMHVGISASASPGWAGTRRLERPSTASYPALLARFGETHWSPKIARDGIAEAGAAPGAAGGDAGGGEVGRLDSGLTTRIYD